MSFRNPIVEQIAAFLSGVGITVRCGELPESTFLPGILVENGALVIDENRLTYPGDLLHEAGHLALLLPQERASANGNFNDDGGFEMAATAWSYAALRHIGLDPRIVFHDGGYRGSSSAIVENFGEGRYFGVPVLEWLDMSAGEKRAKQMGVPPFPHMLLWLRP